MIRLLPLLPLLPLLLLLVACSSKPEPEVRDRTTIIKRGHTFNSYRIKRADGWHRVDEHVWDCPYCIELREGKSSYYKTVVDTAAGIAIFVKKGVSVEKEALLVTTHRFLVKRSLKIELPTAEPQDDNGGYNTVWGGWEPEKLVDSGKVVMVDGKILMEKCKFLKSR